MECILIGQNDAYKAAVNGGYEGSEADFQALLARGPWLEQKPIIYRISTNDEIDQSLTNTIKNMPNNSMRYIAFNVTQGELWLPGGFWFIAIYKTADTYAVIHATSYTSNNLVLYRVLFNGIWGEWDNFGTAQNTAGYHNSIYRGKYLGNIVSESQYNIIANGKFNNLYIGDYWTINGINWRIAAFDYLLGKEDIPTSKHHIVIVPDSILYRNTMNDTDTIEGAYAGSKLYTEGLNLAKNTIKAAFPGHVLKHRLYLNNAVSNGHVSAGAWYDSEVELMNENMVYGSMIFSPSSFLSPNGTIVPTNNRIETTILPLFQMAPQYIKSSYIYWLRDIVSNHFFARVDAQGMASANRANLDIGVRPYFCISGN